MNAVLGLLDQIDAVKVLQVGRKCEGEHSQGAVRDHPRGYLHPTAVPDNKIAMPILRSLDGLDVLNVRECCPQVPDPLRQPLGRPLLQIREHPGQVRSVRLEGAYLARRARLAEEQAVQDELLDSRSQELLQPGAHRKLGLIGRQVAKRRPPWPKLEVVETEVTLHPLRVPDFRKEVTPGGFADHLDSRACIREAGPHDERLWEELPLRNPQIAL